MPPASITLKSSSELKKVMGAYFQGLDQAARAGSPKVAWCSSIGPSELLIALGFAVYYPENHGALLGASRTATEMIPHAVAAGYSPEICSYLTSDVGAFLKGFTPLSKSQGLASIPRADVLVFNNNQCREVQEWFAFYARTWQVPLLGIHSPRVLGEVKESQIVDVKNQLMDLIPELEKISGQKLDPVRLEEAVHLSKECSMRWRRVLEFAAHEPAPLTFFDACIHMGPAVVLRGTQTALDYYDLLLTELEERVQKGLAAVPEERIRLYWDGMPVWGRLRMLADLFTDARTAVVASTYCNSWIFEALDPAQPLESMARASLECFNVRNEDFKESYIKYWVDLCRVDGVIFHDARTCPYNTNSRFSLPVRMQKNLSLPTVVIDGDLNDLRCFSDEQAKTNIEAFIEQLADTR